MHGNGQSPQRRKIVIRRVTSAVIGVLLAACNGDPLNTSGGTTNSSQAPIISTSPQSTTVTQGQAATFTVAATGAPPLTFQWMRGGIDIPGANSTTYTLQATTPGDSGAVFMAKVSNNFGSVTSSGATLTVQ
jgi:hypothetical protein